MSSATLASSSMRSLSQASRSVLRHRTTTHSTPRPAWRHFSASATCSASLHHGLTLATYSTTHPSRQTHSMERPMQYRSMFIQTETTPNEDSLKFIPGVPVMDDGTAEFLDTKSALTSPLAIRLMGIEGVKSVFYGPDFVTVGKDAETQWSVVKPEIYSTLMEFFSSGQSLFRSEEDREAAGPQDTRILDTDSETVAMIKELLETRVRPAIMEDGGDIEYRGLTDDGYVRVKLKGSCRGCDSSTVTLKSGIERMLMHYIPEVKGVEQVLDLEEEIALDEFQKLEQRISREHGDDAKKESPMAQYMSV
ncbi:HIRA-interacting protein 5 [Rhodofomes roseus]|uniref:HIRA-interacting protein 5 n=1 Tax=Rhodofomes roseus TaxID=34475 RepID=A0ABQ8KGK0_9APHY|nr:HIRA-interacting protein 5 [Rhodofomes roseus]KAH9836796.1 HIRA-interacting protein 5 [Rhodofomes roseus]